MARTENTEVATQVTNQLPAADFVAPDLSDEALAQSAEMSQARTEQMRKLGDSVAQSFIAEGIALGQYGLRRDPNHVTKITDARTWRKGVFDQLTDADRKVVNRYAYGAAVEMAKGLAEVPAQEEGEDRTSYFKRLAEITIGKVDGFIAGTFTGRFYLYSPPEVVEDKVVRAATQELVEAYEFKGQTYIRPLWAVGEGRWAVDEIHDNSDYVSARELGASLKNGRPQFARSFNDKKRVGALWAWTFTLIRAYQHAQEQVKPEPTGVAAEVASMEQELQPKPDKSATSKGRRSTKK